MDKKEISRFQIDHSKIWADGKKYFSLFEKHLPQMEARQKVLIYDISNLETIAEMMSLGNGAEFWIFGNQEVNEALRALGFAFQEVDRNENVERYNIPDMKFDCIIMNPPYDRSLHLKILSEAIKHLKDENSVCVNLSPVRWLQDPLAKYKKNSDYHRFEESVSKHIESLDVYFPKSMSDTFGIQLKTDLAVYQLNLNNHDYDFSSIPTASGKNLAFIQNIYKKICQKTNEFVDSKCIDFQSRTTKNYVFISFIGGTQQRGADQETHDFIRRGEYGAFIGDLYKGRDAKTIKASNKHSVCGNVDTWPVVCFENEVETTNFFNAACTNFLRYLAWAFSSDQHVPNWAIPWLGNSLNPRTGKKGYESEWTDEDFYEFFGITEDEKKTIEETMAKYK